MERELEVVRQGCEASTKSITETGLILCAVGGSRKVSRWASGVSAKGEAQTDATFRQAERPCARKEITSSFRFSGHICGVERVQVRRWI